MNRAVVEKKITAVAQLIAKEFTPEQIILFGSWAWGHPTPDSDVDFLIIKKTNDSRKLAAQIDGRVFPRPFPLDLMVYQPEQVDARKAAGDPFLLEILTKGRVLYAA